MELVDLVKLFIGLQISMFGLLVWHLFKDRDTRVDVAVIRKSIEQIQHDIGDHERGMRGQLHQHSQHLTRHEMDIEVMKRGK